MEHEPKMLQITRNKRNVNKIAKDRRWARQLQREEKEEDEEEQWKKGREKRIGFRVESSTRDTVCSKGRGRRKVQSYKRQCR
jgi:hypothetical protein